MKTGKSLQDLAIEVDRQVNTKKDYIAKTSAMDVVTEGDGHALVLGDKGSFPMTDICHEQVSDHTGIPRQYYNKMRNDAPALLGNNIKTWFDKYPAPRTVRTLDTKSRAFLSDRFSTAFDHYDFMKTILPVLSEQKLRVVSCDLTERKLYVKAISERLFQDVPVGHRMGDGSHKLFDTVAPVIAFGNSEVGFGRWFADTGVYTQVCTNLAMFAKGGMKRTHIGAQAKLSEGLEVDDLEAIMSEATKRKMVEATLLQLRDVVKAAFDEKVVAKRCEKLAEIAGHKIEAKLDVVMERAQERFNLNDDEKDSIFKYLIEGGQLSQYGLHAAITRASQDVPSYDRATELEYLGGKVVELERAAWEELAAA